jgi:hypothetical protein
MRKVVIMGAGGRDFHNFNTVFRDDPQTRVVAFTATQIPGISDRTYPPSLSGPYHPDGIPIVAEENLVEVVRREAVDEVVLAYSDLSHDQVMHQASTVLAAGADFRLLGPRATMLRGNRPVVAVCAARTGCGKSQTTRRVGRILLDAGLRVALVRHPMPYGDLERMRVQRFATVADIDASDPTVEEREEYEAPVRDGMVMFAGVDYGEILAAAQAEADVIVWDGGNNDFPFYAPDVLITVLDPLRPGHEIGYHPGETNLRMADILVLNKTDTAAPPDVQQGPRWPGRGCWSSRTGRASPTAACPSAPGRWPPARPVPRSSIPGRTRWARSPRPTPRTRTSGRCCRRWGTATRNWPSWGRPSAPPAATRWWSGRRSTWPAWSTSGTRYAGRPTSCVRLACRHWPSCWPHGARSGNGSGRVDLTCPEGGRASRRSG